MPLTPKEAERLKALIDELTDESADGDGADSLNPELTELTESGTPTKPEQQKRAEQERSDTGQN